MAFPLVLAAAAALGLGQAIKGRQASNAAAAQAKANYDQEKFQYDLAKAKAEENEQRRIDTINYLQAVMESRGSKINPATFEMLKARGSFKYPEFMPQSKSYRPNFIASLVGNAAETYGGNIGSAALNAPPPYRRPSSYAPTWDGASINPSAWKLPALSDEFTVR